MRELKKHGYSSREGNHPLYNLWRAIKQRCYNPNHKAYKNYGGRGIIMFQEVQS